MKEPIVVIGATGRVGSLVAERLLGIGHAVLALARNTERLRPLAERGTDIRSGALADRHSSPKLSAARAQLSCCLIAKKFCLSTVGLVVAGAVSTGGPTALAVKLSLARRRTEMEALEEIFPDPVSHSIAEGWRNGVSKALERELKAFRRKSQ